MFRLKLNISFASEDLDGCSVQFLWVYTIMSGGKDFDAFHTICLLRATKFRVKYCINIFALLSFLQQRSWNNIYCFILTWSWLNLVCWKLLLDTVTIYKDTNPSFIRLISCYAKHLKGAGWNMREMYFTADVLLYFIGLELKTKCHMHINSSSCDCVAQISRPTLGKTL